jgi:hypothetical protein
MKFCVKFQIYKKWVNLLINLDKFTQYCDLLWVHYFIQALESQFFLVSRLVLYSFIFNNYSPKVEVIEFFYFIYISIVRIIVLAYTTTTKLTKNNENIFKTNSISSEIVVNDVVKHFL